MGATVRNISSLDYLRLINLINNEVGHTAIPAESLHQLYLMLKTSRKIKSDSIPENIVTMNSNVVIKYVRSGKTKTVKIVYPDDPGLSANNRDIEDNISVYNPLALSILGLKEHDVCFSGKGIDEEQVMIDKILFQPEAHRLFNL
jgi:transcription elongation GreA/GreB family factor